MRLHPCCESMVILRMLSRSPANDPRRRISALDFDVANASPTNCHPDRSFSSPKGMRCGVEGPAVFPKRPDFTRIEQKTWVPRSLRLVQGAGACAERKPKPRLRPLTLPSLATSARSGAPGTMANKRPSSALSVRFRECIPPVRAARPMHMLLRASDLRSELHPRSRPPRLLTRGTSSRPLNPQRWPGPAHLCHPQGNGRNVCCAVRYSAGASGEFDPAAPFSIHQLHKVLAPQADTPPSHIRWKIHKKKTPCTIPPTVPYDIFPDGIMLIGLKVGVVKKRSSPEPNLCKTREGGLAVSSKSG